MYCAVIGNPIAHSRSPNIYQVFAEQFDIQLKYERILAPCDGFTDAVESFKRDGGKYLNVTVPFKHDAFALANSSSDLVKFSNSASMLSFQENGNIHADNFDGLGLVTDIEKNWEFELKDKNILLIGAGGAVYGCLPVLLECAPKKIIVVNRSVDKLQALQKLFPAISTMAFSDLAQQKFDLIINGSSSSLQNVSLPLPASIFQQDLFCYDMAYHPQQLTRFLQHCQAHAVNHLRDGLGMLIEQGAQAFYHWYRKTPQTQTLISSRDWLL